MNLTETFCRQLRAICFEALDSRAIEAARRLVLDGIAVAVAGSREEAPGILAKHMRELGGNPQAVAFGFGFRTSTVSAAYLNGASMPVLDYEPMWNPATHALSTTLPSLLALAAVRETDGAALNCGAGRGGRGAGAFARRLAPVRCRRV